MPESPALKQKVDLIARECVTMKLRLVNRVITNLYDEALRPLGLKASQLNILVAAAKLGVAQPAQVCEILQLDNSTLSRNVSRMRARALAGSRAGCRRPRAALSLDPGRPAAVGKGGAALAAGPVAGLRAVGH